MVDYSFLSALPQTPTMKWNKKQHTEWATAGRQILEIDLEGNTDAIGVRSSGDGATDVAAGVVLVEELLFGESRDVNWSRRVVFDDRCIAKSTSDRVGGGLGGSEGEEHSQGD